MRASLIVARILGARRLTQAALSDVGPSPEVLAMGVWVDCAHATLASAWPQLTGRARAAVAPTPSSPRSGPRPVTATCAAARYRLRSTIAAATCWHASC